MSIRITFASNFINHHQMPFCNEMYRRLGDDFSFIQVQPMDENRINMGWDADTDSIRYLHKMYESEEKCLQLIRDCDILILGWTGLSKSDTAEKAIRERMDSSRPVIRISERIYREGRFKAISPRGLIAKYDEHIKYRNSHVYMLCAGAYVSGDFHMIGAYPGKMFKWGYFPPYIHYSEEKLESHLYKEGERLELCFAGRMIKLKHPEFPIFAAEYLEELGIPYRLHMVGEGPLLGDLQNQTADRTIAKNIIFHGAASPDEVRLIMEDCHIALFCSNYLEGWGAVVNEAMNSACAVIASKEAGAVPFLIKDGINGLVYDKCDKSEFLRCLKELSTDGDKIRTFQKRAYKTISDTWNAENACERLLKFCESEDSGSLPKDGPMSPAEIFRAPGFMRTIHEDNHLE